jgi:hypothetical protein
VTSEKRIVRANRAFAWILTFVFLAGAAAVTCRHEIWRDEAQAWLLAKDAVSLPDLSLRIGLDGHPPLWYWALFLITRITDSPAAMQIVHLLLAAAAVFVLARWAPFSRLQKILFAFGYPIFYEYAVIARDYAVGILALFVFCAVYPRRERHMPALALLLILMALSNVPMTCLSIALTIMLILERIVDGTAGVRPRLFWPALGLASLGQAAALRFSVFAGAGGRSELASRGLDGSRLLEVLRIVPKSYLYAPKPDDHFWNSEILSAVPWGVVVLHALAAAFLLFAVLALRRRPDVLAFYVLGTGALLVVFYFVHIGYTRQRGHIFLVLLAAFWLAAAALPHAAGRPPTRAARAAPAFLTLCLAVQAAGGIVAVVQEIRLPFSQARRTADFIRLQDANAWVLVGDIHYAMSGISAYLGRPIYYPRIGDWGTYTVWVRERTADLGLIVSEAERISRETGKSYLLILNYPLSPDSLRSRRLRPAARFDGAVRADESFYLYRRDGRSPILVKSH